MAKKHLLTQYYLKEYELIICEDEEPAELKNMLNCLVDQKLKSNFWYCNINETLMINGEDYECSETNTTIEEQPYLGKEDMKELKNYHKLEIILKNNVSIININEHTFNASLCLDQEIEYNIILLLPNYTIKIYTPMLKDDCYNQKVAIALFHHFYNSTLISVMVPTMIISICCAFLIIIVYLSQSKLRTMYFVICHCTSYITHQILYINNYKYYTKKSLVLSQAIFFILQAAFIMSAYCWINVFSYQLWTALTRSVAMILC